MLRLHNTLSGEKEVFTPIDPAHVRLYACGPTVYDYAHIGNARMAVVFDLLARVLRRIYPRVTYVSNITDVDDKIIEAAKRTGQLIDEITRKFTGIYNRDMAALGVAAPDIQPLATQHIAAMIAMIEDLIARGHAYEAQGHVLFAVPSFPLYGTLSRRSRDEQVAGARVEVAPYKKDPADFVLWKPSDENQPGWDSPWGRGRPGWHIECSAMSAQHLGLPFDIHGGGADLKFPHHENEIAQSCCAAGHADDIRAFARMWVHNGFVTVEGEKMSKSLGNFTLVHDMVAQHPGEVLRLTLLSAHYRQPLDWTARTIEQNRAFLDGLYRTLYDLGAVAGDNADEDDVPDDVMAPLCDDLNTPMAFAALKALAQAAAKDRTPAAKTRLLAAGRFMGLLGQDPAQWLGFGQAGDVAEAALIEEMLQQRQQARVAKDFARADQIRDRLKEMKIEIEDAPGGTSWRRAQ